MWRIFASLMLMLMLMLVLPCSGALLASGGGDMQIDKQGMQSQRYELIKVSSAMPPPGRWEREHDSVVIDLLAFKDMLDAEPDTPSRLRSYVARLTDDFTRSFYLKGVISRDDGVYYSHYWTAKSSVLTIVEYRKEGSSTDLTSYLGPLSKVPTASYGPAKFAFNYKGEVLSFWGVAQKDSWSIRKKYWSAAQVYLPLDESSGADIAVIGMQLPSSYMEPVGTFILLPRGL